MTAWRMAFRDFADGPSFWDECRQRGVAAITYEPVADVDFSAHPTAHPTPGWYQLRPVEIGCLRHFINDVEVGDTIYAKEGPAIVGRGTVTGSYEFDAGGPIVPPNGRTAYHHQRRVQWDPDFQPVNVQVGHPPIQTILELGPADVARIEGAHQRMP